MVERTSGALPLGEGRLIEFLDRDGSLVALRPDVTTAVARLVAQRYRDVAAPLRLSYFGPVFREEPAMTAGEREVDQAGVELIGPSGELADAEVLGLLGDALARCGAGDGTIEVGHVGVVRRLFAELHDEVRETVMRELRDGDHVGALRRAKAGGMSESGLAAARSALAARGRDIEGINVEGVMELREVIHLARELSPDPENRRFVPNLALIPELPYYTGVVFEALSPDVGVPLAAGGRYDVLLAAFGAPRPATGFAINVPRLHAALFASGWRPARARALVALEGGTDARATLRLAARLRSAGVAVAIGAVAEPAGQPVLAAQVVDAERVRLADGRIVRAEELARELGT